MLSALVHMVVPLFVLSTTANLQLLDSPIPDGVHVRLRVHTIVCEYANHSKQCRKASDHDNK